MHMHFKTTNTIPFICPVVENLTRLFFHPSNQRHESKEMKQSLPLYRVGW